MSVLVLQHEAVEGPGRIAVELRLHRHDFEIIRLDLDPQVPPFDSERTGLVVLGGSMGRTNHKCMEPTLQRWLHSS